MKRASLRETRYSKTAYDGMQRNIHIFRLSQFPVEKHCTVRNILHFCLSPTKKSMLHNIIFLLNNRTHFLSFPSCTLNGTF
jgi:hypothetical protein